MKFNRNKMLVGVGVVTKMVAGAVESADLQVTPCEGPKNPVCRPGTSCVENVCSVNCLRCPEMFNRFPSTISPDCTKVWQDCGVCLDSFEAAPGQEKCTAIATTVTPTADSPFVEDIAVWWSIALPVVVVCVLCVIAFFYFCAKVRRRKGNWDMPKGDNIAMIQPRAQYIDTSTLKDSCWVLESSHIKKRCISHVFRIASF